MREAAADGPFPLALAFALGFVPRPLFIGLGDPEAFFIAALFLGLGDAVKSTTLDAARLTLRRAFMSFFGAMV